MAEDAGTTSEDGRADGADPGTLLRSPQYRRLLVVSGVLGIVISVAAWGFLELTAALQEWVWVDLPDALGFAELPWWWPLPVLGIAGVLIAVAIERLPGTGGHEPSRGLTAGSPSGAADLPGVIAAALASIGLGMVLGPEAPLIAIGSGLTLLLIGLARRDVPDQAAMVLVAASGFAALATIFGSPIVGAIIIVEAAGIGGPRLPLVLLPGLIAAGIGSLVFIGVGSMTGLSSQAYAIAPLSLAPYPKPNFGDLAWTITLSAAAAVVVFVIVEIGRVVAARAGKRRLVITVAGALSVAALAIAFGAISDLGPLPVVFSGQEALGPLVRDASTLSLGVLALLVLTKGLAWGVSLGVARGGPTFPAIFLGVAGGLLASHLPGFAEAPAVGVLVGAGVVAVLRLPLSAVVIALLITQGGAAVAPLVIVGVAVSYIVIAVLDHRREAQRPAAT
jgi:H+/Cl- antiporter ClcA